MNLNKRKALNFICICSTGLGLVILTVSPGIALPKVDVVQKSGKVENAVVQVLSAEADTPLQGEAASLLSEATPDISPIPTEIPTPTPLPVYTLEDDGYPAAINQLIQTYYQAKLNCDMDTLKSISSEPSAVIDEDSLKQLIEGIDDYSNITCYVKKSYQDDAYIVWAYHDIKFIGLKTSAPALSKFYVLKDDQGVYKIFDGEMSEELKEYFDHRSQDKDVVELMAYTENLAAKAKESDQDLNDYWAVLDKQGTTVAVTLD